MVEIITRHFELEQGILSMFLSLLGADKRAVKSIILGGGRDVWGVAARERNNNQEVEKWKKEEQERVLHNTYLIVSFAGLNDPITWFPKSWADKIKSMLATSSLDPLQIHTIALKRSSEDKTIEAHATEAQVAILAHIRMLGVGDIKGVKLILVAESYGGLVAAQLALRGELAALGVEIIGMVTIRTPWEGVSLAQAVAALCAIKPVSATLNVLKQQSLYDGCLGALATLHPKSSFIKNLKRRGLSKLNFPILALAGRDITPSFPYAAFPRLPLLLRFFPSLTPLVKLVKGLLPPYKAGNDGVVTVTSATAATSRRPVGFESHVLNNFPHVGNTRNHPEALRLLKVFIKKITRPAR